MSFPRAKICTDKNGVLTIRVMQNGWERCFFFAAGEKHSLASAVVNSIANPGVNYDVSWDEEARK